MATQVVVDDAPTFERERRWPRHKLNLPVRVVVQKAEKTTVIDGRGTELNQGGIAVFVGTELRVGDEVEVEFTPPYSGHPLRVTGAVRDRRGYYYGLEFIGRNDEEQRQVAELRAVLHSMAKPS